MEPKYPTTNNVADGSQPPSGPKKWGRFPRSVWIVAIIIVVLLFVIGIVMMLSRGDKKGSTTQETGNAYYDRPGFDRSKMSDAIGDPAPLVTKPGGEAATYQGTRVIQACNLLTVEDVRKAGFQLKPNSLSAFGRTYFDGQGTGQLNPSPFSLTSLNDSNSCGYPIYKPDAGVSIEVYQPPYSLPQALDYEIGREYQQNGTVEGLTQYTRTDRGGRQYYLLRDGNQAVLIYFRDLADQATVQKFVGIIAANYKREAAAPTGPIQFAYDTPIFKKSYLNACAVTTAADIQSLFGTIASPLVTEEVTTATGVTYYNTLQDETRYARIDHMCRRPAASGSGLGDRRSLTVETASFLSDQGAKREMESSRRMDKDVTKVSSKIGDDVFFSYTTGQNPEMTVRKGRFVLNIGMYNRAAPNMGAQEMIRALTPVAKEIVSRIKD